MDGDKFFVNIFRIIVLFFLIRFSVQADESKNVTKKPEERHEVRKHGHEERSQSMSEASQEKEEDEERANEVTNQIQILEDGDPFTFLLVNNVSKCLLVTEDDIPDNQKGLQSFKEDCGTVKT